MRGGRPLDGQVPVPEDGGRLLAVYTSGKASSAAGTTYLQCCGTGTVGTVTF